MQIAVNQPGLPPHEVQKAENSSKKPEKSGKRNRKSEKKRKSIFLRDFTISKGFNHFFFYL
jgi:hypothetical protein